MSITDADLTRLGVKTIGDRIRIRELCHEYIKRQEGEPSPRHRSMSTSNTIRSRPSSSALEIQTERNLLFSPYPRSGHRSPRRPGSSKKAKRTWTGHFVCLANHRRSAAPSAAEKEILHMAGLGYKKVKFDADSSAQNMIDTLTSDEKDEDGNALGFPQLRDCGGFEMLRSSGAGSKILTTINCGWSVKELKANIGPQAKVFLRPIQKSLSTIALAPEVPTVVTEKCNYCNKVFDVTKLREHIDYSCHLSDSEENAATESFGIPIIEEETSNGLETQANETADEILSQEGVENPEPMNEETESIDAIVDDAVQYCNVHNVNNPVEVLRCFQKLFVTGRPLEVENEAEVCEGETNFIMINREDVLSTAFSELKEIEDYRKTLEVQFYDERAADFGGPRKEFFNLSLRAIKERYFDDGLKEHVHEDYYYVGLIMALSMVQNGKLPQFMENILDELFNSDAPSPCILRLRKGLKKLGIYQLCCQIPTFVHLFRPSPTAKLSVKKIKELLKPTFRGGEGSNTRMFEKSVYASFLEYVREVASGRRGQLTLGRILQFVTGTDEEPILGFVLHPQIIFTQSDNASFLPSANTCTNCLQLPRPNLTCSLPSKVQLFETYDLAFSQDFFGNV